MSTIPQNDCIIPKFVFVIPTYNSHKQLPKLVNSLLSQKYTLWKAIFIDGPSNNEHKNFIKSLCQKDSRFNLVQQNKKNPGIYGAMNQGFNHADDNEWMIFWGSDDWASSNDVLEEISTQIIKLSGFNLNPDLIVCEGLYFKKDTLIPVRKARFINKRIGTLNNIVFRKFLINGYTPPHQATIFGVNARRKLSKYSQNYQLASDLDYFINISKFENLRVFNLPLKIVHISTGGQSNQKTFLRFTEVIKIYIKYFKILFFIPFILRYINRLRLIKSLFL